MSKIAESAKAIRNAVSGGCLSEMPVRLLVDVELPDGRRGIAGHVAWMTRADANACEMRNLGVILAACSVLRPCKTPEGFGLRVEADIVTLPFAFAEALEAEGAVKVLRTDALVAIHKAAWNEAVEKQKAAIRRGREMTREAQEFAKKAGSSTAFRPVINWDAPPVVVGAEDGQTAGASTGAP